MAQFGKLLGKLAGVVAALGILALIVWAFIKGVESDPAVVGPIFTAVLGLIVVVYQRTREKRQELERVHRDEMSPIYEQLIEMVKTIEEFAKKTQDEQMAFFREISTKLLLHGPSPVVRAWVAWNQVLGVTPLSVPMRAQEKLMLAIREDLGHDNSTLKPGDLVRLYILEEDTDESRTFWKELRSGN